MVKVHGQKNLHKNKYECIRKSSDVHKASCALFCYCLKCKHVLGRAACAGDGSLLPHVGPEEGTQALRPGSRGHLLSLLISTPFSKRLFILCGVGVYRHHAAHVIAKGTLRKSVLFFCYESLKAGSGHEAWQLVPLLTDPSPPSPYYVLNVFFSSVKMDMGRERSLT